MHLEVQGVIRGNPALFFEKWVSVHTARLSYKDLDFIARRDGITS